MGEDKHRVTIGTKFGNIRGPNGERGGTNGKPDYVQRACEASLERLGVDIIDLYKFKKLYNSFKNNKINNSFFIWQFINLHYFIKNNR